MWRIAVWTLIIGLILIHSIRVAYTVDFFAINGTFQNFNPIRRLLAGEFPYKDFTIYLGLGHLFIGSIFATLDKGKQHKQQQNGLSTLPKTPPGCKKGGVFAWQGKEENIPRAGLK